MYKPLSIFIGLRYLRAKRRNRFASFIAIASTTGIALGVAVLIIVMSVMNGFEREVAGHVAGMTAHATSFELGVPMSRWQEIATDIRKLPHVEGVEPFIRGSGMLNRRGAARGIVLYGVDPETESHVTKLADYLGSTPLSALKSDGPIPNIMIGSTLAETLRLTTGDVVSLIVPRWAPNQGMGSPLFQQLRIAGIFQVGMHEFDSTFAIIDIHAAAEIFQFRDAVSGLRIRFDDLGRATEYALAIREHLGDKYLVLDWTEFHRNFFQALKSQKRILFVILSLIIAVAAFNIIASMIMVVKEKLTDIAILRTLGYAPMQILAMFIVQGTMISLVGIALGIGIGTTAAGYASDLMRWLEKMFDIQLIKPEVYYISYLPTQIQLADLVLVSLTAFGVCLLATFYPAWRASNIVPVDALRYD